MHGAASGHVPHFRSSMHHIAPSMSEELNT